MKRHFLLLALLTLALAADAAETVNFGKGRLTITNVARNAIRIQYAEQPAASPLPDFVYVKHDELKNCDVKVNIDRKRQLLTLKDSKGKLVFTATAHQMNGEQATLTFRSPVDEFLFGLGQFQDGFSNVRGLSRRLTQVNTQISLPMLL